MREDPPILNMSNPQHRKLLKGYIDSLKGIYRFEFTRVRSQRTLAQNAYLHGVVLPIIAAGMSEAWGCKVTTEEAKQHVKDEFLRKPRIHPDTGEVLSWYTESTANLNVSECIEFIEKVIEFGRDKLNVTVPPAREYEEQAA